MKKLYKKNEKEQINISDIGNNQKPLKVTFLERKTTKKEEEENKKQKLKLMLWFYIKRMINNRYNQQRRLRSLLGKKENIQKY